MTERLPHDGVYARIQQSAIHGIGVFAIRDIPTGTAVFAGDDERLAWVPQTAVSGLPEEIRRLYEDFCIRKDGSFGCPQNFNQLTTAWYLNHSEKPNVGCDRNYNFFALRLIKHGEELLSDYGAVHNR